MNPDRLRTRLMVAAQKFATEIADAVLEATGDPEGAPEAAPKRRKPHRSPPVVDGPVSPEAAKRAADALAKLGIRNTG